ncbi:DUF4301 family protein [Flaviramulus sp. BrNp1-15]|uniref:DUF4301 family protein n=1 Tax=Flaviramulus sp. BrNp1-15 TaxID=2916754 RepID=UPI001EE96679|nr:DUF4301 family protein [Flaviramulus sp. BrNp1-15]ULC60005.1 DUF4301 family protein [Flaviramulus sp. BrNp1-15]
MEEKLKQQPSNCIKVVLFGPESTGKTTLSNQLARYYNSVWVPEYAREYLQNKWNNERKTCEPKDLLPIAKGQMKLENKLAKKTDTVLICDTDLLETKVYSETYYLGTCDPILENYALKNTYDLYFLTYIDTPWEADDLRDKPEHREEMFKAFEKALVVNNRPYVLLKGDKKTRLETAVKHIDKLLKEKTMFTEKDIQQITNKGITLEQVKAQVSRIRNGMSYSNLISAATIGNGIESYSEEESKDFIKSFDEKQNNLNLVKFVPASGAATRMFKFLFQFLNNFNPEKDTIESYAERQNDSLIKTFISGLEKLPFYEEILLKAKDINPNFDSLSKNEVYLEIVKTILSEDGLNYNFLPKGLLSFHKYSSGTKTPFEEHLIESTMYASSNGKANLHFTISEKHHSYFDAELNRVKNHLEKETNTTFNVSYSYQKEATETLALNVNNEIFRNEDGSILFRPAGHGALLENLNDLNNDIVFIKNVDNIVVLDLNKKLSEYKKMIAGVLIEAQEKAFSYLHNLDSNTIEEEKLIEIAGYISSKMNVVINDAFDDYSHKEKIEYLKNKLNRPIRVCGMVKNEGEPGGGPFWVKDKNGNTSLQIVEFAQIDIKNKTQADIVKNATHFNPTDLVCGIKNYKGEKFDLMKYVDPEAAFITMKTQNGIDIQALELPGLWNGSMAFWNTIFVEVPLSTFNPVKTVNDLLKPVHQV